MTDMHDLVLTCRCGARLHITSTSGAQVTRERDAFNEAHNLCPGAVYNYKKGEKIRLTGFGDMRDGLFEIEDASRVDVLGTGMPGSFFGTQLTLKKLSEGVSEGG